ncbi:hypothetical protein M3P05_01385 [Sansalvadorimonas sp. 2012CJ34-2]|uniref:Uncharacterized protein n=1 Tax=Parendozoicomonas callyspongiae TaxID=2942213 RepID=A0ABT0PBL5_9GAMM|nr:hypothetical protein [Sansalvadorimonas sp. 2012CJ34-2]MCL6268606.1 hypothetical protein [Sansalvadorimonas sp. 2012CJ34-2]
MSQPTGGVTPPGPGNIPNPPPNNNDKNNFDPNTAAGRKNIRQHKQARKQIPAAQPNNNPTPRQNLKDRKPSALPGEAPLTSKLAPPEDDSTTLEEAKNQVKSVIDELWVRDQLEIITKIVDHPELAAALGCVIKVKLPNTTESVQVYPLTGKIGPHHLPRYLEPLKASAQKALDKKLKDMPDHQLYSAYVLHRSKVFELGKAEAHSKGKLFDWAEVFQPMLTGSITKEFSGGGVSFSLTRQEPDPKHADQLNDMRKALNSGKSKQNIMPQKKSKKKNNKPKKETPSTALNKPAIDLRINANRHEIENSRLTAAERQALNNPNPNPPLVPPAEGP